ncbi:MAG: hypothetical protein RML35_14415 [Chloroherpetonaceae bacterium]|nr:hypothetical protein [Chloroherpetonaceae bacterium]
MQKTGVALLLCVMLLSCTAKRDPRRVVEPAGSANFRVGLVFDVGGRGDKSFNDAAYLGLERAARELSLEARVY